MDPARADCDLGYSHDHRNKITKDFGDKSTHHIIDPIGFLSPALFPVLNGKDIKL